MKTQHTIGPWKVELAQTTPGLCIVTPKGGTAYIGDDNLKFNRGEQAANARLIAAAPDLLEALQDAEFLLRKAGQIGGPMQDSFNRSAEDARAAIAKATN
jgi:hypothetical protein